MVGFGTHRGRVCVGWHGMPPVACSVGRSSSRRFFTVQCGAVVTAASVRVARQVAAKGLRLSLRWMNRLHNVQSCREKLWKMISVCRTSAGADPLGERIRLSACATSRASWQHDHAWFQRPRAQRRAAAQFLSLGLARAAGGSLVRSLNTNSCAPDCPYC